MQTLLQDARFAFRLLWKSPGFTLIAVLALALGIGANTAIFSVVESVLLRPLPLANSGRMVVIWETSPGQGWSRIGPSGPNYLDFRDQNRSLEAMAIIEPGTATVTGFGEPQQIPGMRVSTSFLSFIGVRPILGRDFQPGEGWNQRVAIIGHNLWIRYFGGDSGVIGKRVIADGLPYTVVGVLPASFWSPVRADVLVPWADADLRGRHRMDHHFGVLGVLKKGITVAQATAELSGIERRIGDQFIDMKGWGVTVAPIQEALVENVRMGLVLLLVAVALVLLIACANLANLMLARAAVRSREAAVRLALGAGRGRLVRQFLTESTLLALSGGLLGLVLALWGVDVLQRIVPETMRLSEGAGDVLRPHIAVDVWVLLFTLAVSLVTGIVFGLAPAFAASNSDVNEMLKGGGRTASAGGRRMRSFFVISEIAVALVLLIGAGLSLKSFWLMRKVNPGFIPDRVLAMEMELPTDSKYRTDVEQAAFFRNVLEKLAAVPGMRTAGVTSILPLDEENDRTEFLIEGRPAPASGQPYPADYRAVSADYFSALGVPLRRGRYFSARDAAQQPLVAIINDSLAKRYWPNGTDPVGLRLHLGHSLYEIVGVVGDVKHSGLDRQATPTIYTSFLQNPEPRMSLVVRTSADPASMIREVKNAVYSVDGNQPMYKIRTMDQVLSDSQSSPRFTMFLLGAFAAAALLLAAAGIYGVISYTVAQGTRELGIRIALGAQRRDILRLVVGDGMVLSLAGVGIGLVVALLLTRVMARVLYGVSATDPITFAATAGFLALIALLASYLPARRASNTDPTLSLRFE